MANLPNKIIRLRLILLTAVICSLVGNVRCAEVLSTNRDVCRYFKDGVMLRKPGYCTIGIKCENFKSIEYLTCESNKFYDRNTRECGKSSSDSYCNSPCTTKTTGFIADPKNCLGWYKCDGKTSITYGYCPSSLRFNAKKQLCDYAENASCKATYDICDVAPNLTPFQYEDDDCSTYRQCVTSKSVTTMATKTCETGKYFDLKRGACIDKAFVNCKKYPYPNAVCGTSKLALRNRFVSDGATCRGYFYCKDFGVGKPDSTPQWAQCSPTTFFEPTEMACMARTYVKCAEDRCDGRDDGYELSSKVGCRHYLVCSSNRTIAEKYCGDNMWFDSASEKCTPIQKSYRACM